MTDKLLTQSKTQTQAFFRHYADLLRQLADKGQSPQALFIGCADSRLTPEQMLGLQPGDHFMHRNIANIIPPYIQTEIGIASILEYAVMALEIPRIILCGHTDCGGIHGLDSQIDLARQPALSRWINLARPAQQAVDSKIGRSLTPQERHLAIVERNVLLQLEHLRSYPYVREAQAANRLTLHGWVYDLHQQRLGYHNPETNEFIYD